MAGPMRVLPLLLLALLIAPMVPAQGGMDITSSHQVRIAYGDIPATDEVENADRWNVQQLLVLPEGANGTATIPADHSLGAISCSPGCSFDADLDDNTVTATCQTATDDGVCAITIPHSVAGPLDAFGMSLEVADDNTVFVYVPVGLQVTAATDNLVGDDFYYPGTVLLIHQYNAEDGRFWFTASPQTTVVDPASGFITWQGILIGLAAGAVAWYLLVRQGIVQKRQRKQVAGVAAHKEASKEGKTTLEWRRRALLAAMKELEVARMDQAIDLAAYDSLKADFKKQTVTVMRALEELGE